ncbi:three-Cys-motif partner protein TcmP [Methylobacterium sp. WL9]|uniref:three-Cys-motif partner protein TcmP n=1 Tax=Methylobacterium sp. WL9 TaxID=2603898 RepID=UPI00164EDD3C|nr:three-Cys-motif partner protein TcmP [Methylobacterium sp. WL9]
MSAAYHGREQTQTKHYILRNYLQALSFKVLTFTDITYVDGFSGPWETRTEDFSDSSFMIAIRVLKDAQQRYFEATGRRRRIRCYFSETGATAYAQLQRAVAEFNKPEDSFEVRTFNGRFEDAIDDIQEYIGNSLPLIFIDPTGWTGYPLPKIRRLFDRPKAEVLINFMYSFVSRFVNSGQEDTVASLDPILGGPGWRDRLDKNLPRGVAVERLFRESLQSACGFKFVVSTRIDKPTVDMPHFFLAYGTKTYEGLKAFRETEYGAVREQARLRVGAGVRRQEEKTGLVDMFAGWHADVKERGVDDIVTEEMHLAEGRIISFLQARGPTRFQDVAARAMQALMLRETNVKNVCVKLANDGLIENTWGKGTRKPKDNDLIRLLPRTE